jgi:hypothetical protein
MRFMLLIKADADYEAGELPRPELLIEIARYVDELARAGAMIECNRLFPSSAGVRVRCSQGKITVVDGPFTETKELVAGYLLLQADSLAAAIEWAQRAPFESGEIDIRPLFELEDFPVDPAEQPEGWREKEAEMKVAPPLERRPGTRRYLGMLKGDSATEAGVMPDEKLLTDMGAFMEEGIKAGILLGGEGLKPTSAGARVRFDGKNRVVVDGPFTETKEIVAGYAMLQFATREEAIEWTKRFVQVDSPGRLNGECECELREVWDEVDFADGEALRQFAHSKP